MQGLDSLSFSKIKILDFIVVLFGKSILHLIQYVIRCGPESVVEGWHGARHKFELGRVVAELRAEQRREGTIYVKRKVGMFISLTGNRCQDGGSVIHRLVFKG